MQTLPTRAPPHHNQDQNANTKKMSRIRSKHLLHHLAACAAASLRHHQVITTIPPPPPPLLHRLFSNPRAFRSFLYFSSSSDAGGGALKCWSCGSHEAFLSCGQCGAVQPVDDDDVNYFQIFGIKGEYGIKADNLEEKYKTWQKKLHPDLVHSKSEKERGFAEEQSARVIDAYRTLKKPLSRALYLLKLAGVHINEEQTITDPDLLMEMMEIHDAIDEANNSEVLKEIQLKVQSKLEAWSSSFQQSFDKKDFDSAVVATQRMRYYERALEQIVKKL